MIGGGSTPSEYLPTRLLCISSRRYSASELEERLRKNPHVADAEHRPVLARISEDQLVLDLRTVFPAQEKALVAALTAAMK